MRAVDRWSQIGSRGFDVFFDNVGGFILNETLRRINMRARIVVCGAISSYNVDNPRDDVVAPTNYMSLISLRARMEGFIVFDFAREYHKARAEMAEWILKVVLVSLCHNVSRMYCTGPTQVPRGCARWLGKSSRASVEFIRWRQHG